MGKNILFATAGAVLCVIGAALLVLPGPGLLMVLAGVVVLAYRFTWAQRLVEPVRTRAVYAAQLSISTPVRAGASILGVVALIVAGIVWMVVPSLPLGGLATGIGLIGSGVALLGLLAYTAYRYGGRTSVRQS